MAVGRPGRYPLGFFLRWRLPLLTVRRRIGHLAAVAEVTRAGITAEALPVARCTCVLYVAPATT